LELFHEYGQYRYGRQQSGRSNDCGLVMRLRRMGKMTMVASVGQAAWATHRQWRALPADRRDRLQALLRESARRPSSLSAAQFQELRGLVAELNLGEVLRESTMRASRRGFRRRW
jgi:hypothetical protein